MAFVAYFLVLIAAVGSVLFGWDVLVTPPASKPKTAVVATLAPAPPPAPVPLPEARPLNVPAAVASAESAFAPEPALKGAGNNEFTPRAATAGQAPSEPSGPSEPRQASETSSKCDVQACADRHISFRASDCTYQTYIGVRRMCTIPPRAGSEAKISPHVANAHAQATCNVDACSRAYFTFTASDCTYQPSGSGPRRICSK